MCEIFPEVDNCCLCVSLRLAMVFISVLCIMTGVTGLCAIEKESNASYDSMKNLTNIKDVKKPEEMMGHISQLVPAGITAMCIIFIICGFMLMFGNFTDQEGFIQAFVWLTFVNVIIGFFLVVGVAFECISNSKSCLLKNLDWLSSSFVLVATVFYLCMWIYFIIVANTYVVSIYQ